MAKDLMFDKGLPAAVYAEKALLGAMMAEPHIMAQIADGLDPQDLTVEKHRRIFKQAVKLYKIGRPVDRVSLAESLQTDGLLESVDGVTFICELEADAVPGIAIDGWVRTIQDKAALRRAIFGCQAVIEDALARAEDSPAIIDRITRLTESLQVSARGQEVIPTVMEVAEQAGVPLIFGDGFNEVIPTPWIRLNQIIGGLERGQMVCIGARPSLGKTCAVVQIAEYAAKVGRTAVIFSLEMSRVSLIQRMIASNSGVPLFRVRGGNMNPEDRASAQRALVEITELSKLRMGEFSDTIAKMRTALAKLSTQHKVDLVVIDYLQLMCASNSRRRVEEITEISRGVKLLAKQFDCTVVVASQLSREQEKEDREPRLSDLRDSGSIEQDSDLVIFPYRLPRQPAEATAVNMEFIVSKHRNGRLGRVPVIFEKPFVRFVEG